MALHTLEYNTVLILVLDNFKIMVYESLNNFADY